MPVSGPLEQQTPRKERGTAVNNFLIVLGCAFWGTISVYAFVNFWSHVQKTDSYTKCTFSQALHDICYALLLIIVAANNLIREAGYLRITARYHDKTKRAFYGRQLMHSFTYVVVGGFFADDIENNPWNIGNILWIAGWGIGFSRLLVAVLIVCGILKVREATLKEHALSNFELQQGLNQETSDHVQSSSSWNSAGTSRDSTTSFSWKTTPGMSQQSTLSMKSPDFTMGEDSKFAASPHVAQTGMLAGVPMWKPTGV